MIKTIFLRKSLIVSFICILMLMPLSVTQSKEWYPENVSNTNNAGQIKIISLKADSASIVYSNFGHIGPIWLPSSPLQFNIRSGSLQLKINGELQNVDLPVWIWLRYYFGIGPSLKDMQQGLGVKSFGICGHLAVMPYSWLFDYIYNQPLFKVNDIVKFGQTAWGLASADFNNDGYTDFAVSFADVPFTHSTISIFYNNGNGSFTRDDVYTFNYSYITDLNAGDYNNDGHIDLLFTYSEYVWYNGRPVYINGVGKLLLNDGSNHFGNATTVFWHGPGVPYDEENRINPQITSADYDRDGNLDFLVGDNSGKVELYDNDGSGNFTSAGVINDWGAGSWGLTSGDFDGDGKIDFLVAAGIDYNSTQGYIYLVRNQMNESTGVTCFPPGAGEKLLSISAVPPATACLQSLDYNKDGKLDFIVGIMDSVYLCINKQNSFDIFHLGILPPLPQYGGYSDDLGLGAITSADYNKDGKADILVGGVQGAVRLCLNNYSQQVPPLKPSINAPGGGGAVVGKPAEFTFTAKDINGADVSYWVDWGDGTNSGWVGPFVSGDEAVMNHTWTRALSFYIKVKAKNNYGESEWKNYVVIVFGYGAQSEMGLIGSFTKNCDNRFLVFAPTINDITTTYVSKLDDGVTLSNSVGLATYRNQSKN